jgi:TfoX/Sxy family transcriptional regulator of competence genes
MGKPAAAAPADKVELYEKLVATNPSVKRKGATMPYTSLNGHMFSLLTKTGKLALRLPADARDAFLKKYKTKLCEQYGTVLKEYVEVPDALLENTKELKKFFDLSYAYVGALKPKPTTSKKKPAKKQQAEGKQNLAKARKEE